MTPPIKFARALLQGHQQPWRWPRDAHPEERQMSITDERENFKMQPIYQAIVAHQRGADGWANHEKLLWLREWGHRFIKELGLKNKDGEYLGMPLVKVEPLNIKTVCCYRKAADGYALTGTIVANEKRLGDEPDFETLTHLLEALLG